MLNIRGFDMLEKCWNLDTINFFLSRYTNLYKNKYFFLILRVKKGEVKYIITSIDLKNKKFTTLI